jgi:hypothetical protein
MSLEEVGFSDDVKFFFLPEIEGRNCKNNLQFAFWFCINSTQFLLRIYRE